MDEDEWQSYDDFTIVEDESDRTPEHPLERCLCGNVVEHGGPDSLVGLSIPEWPCCANGNWRYCATTGVASIKVK